MYSVQSVKNTNRICRMSDKNVLNKNEHTTEQTAAHMVDNLSISAEEHLNTSHHHKLQYVHQRKSTDAIKRFILNTKHCTIQKSVQI